MNENNNKRPVAIRIEGVKKMYRLGRIGGGSLQADLQSWWARKRGREDPNTKIGQEQRLVGKTFMALNGIDLTVYKGEAIGIIGHNGAGKSTLLKILSQVTGPTEGTIDLYGRVASMLEVGTGFSGEMTGRENIYMNGAILGMTRTEIDAKIEDIIEFSEVRDFIDTPVKRYSSGMYVKLAFSVAAHLDSEIMIMDEVLAVGDVAFQKKCLDKMREVANKEGRTVLYVSHNMNTIRRLCDRVVVLDQGRIIFDGDVETGISLYCGDVGELATRYDFSRMRPQNERPGKIIMTGLNILDKDKARFKRGEKIRVQLFGKARKAVKNAGFRLELFANGVVSGTSFMDSKFDVEEDEEFSLLFELDTKNFVPIQYRAVALIYEDFAYGQQRFFDRIEPAMVFEIEEDAGMLDWLHYWGTTRYDDIQLIEKKREEINI